MSEDNKELEKEIKKNLKKELKKEHKKERKAIKKEHRKMKREAKKVAYKALNKGQKGTFWLKRIVVTVVVIGALGYIGTNASIAVISKVVLAMYQKSLDTPVEQEKILKLAAPDEEGAARVEKLETFAADDTWAIYIYMCGSNLESLGRDSTSDLTKVLTAEEATAYLNNVQVERSIWLSKYLNEIQKQGMDLPSFMYEPKLRKKTSTSSEEEKGEIVEPGCSTNDLAEIMAVELPENIKVIIQTGGARDWSKDEVNPNRSQRFIYDKDGFRMLEDNHIQNMGNAQTFADFLKYCKEEHSADHTMLSIWNHGGGAFGFVNDENFNMDGITLKECETALSQVYVADEKNPPFELIGFDACLMASMEAAEVLHGYGKYMAASEETEGGDGWDYTAWLSELAANPGMNGAQIGKAIADSFIEYYAQQTIQLSWLGLDFESTFSIVDLNQAHEVYEAYIELMRKALQDMGENTGVMAQLSQAARGSIHYAGNSYNVINTLDLGQFMINLSDKYPEEAGKVLSELEEAVMYNRAFSYAADSMGLSVYFPADIDDISGVYYYLEYMNTVCDDPAMNAVYYYKLAGCMGEEQQEYIKSQGYKVPEKMNVDNLKELSQKAITMGEGANFSVTVEEDTEKLIQDVTLCVARVDEKENRLIYYGQDDFLDWKDDDGTLETDFDAKWVSIDGEPFLLEIIYSNEKVIRYRSPIIWNKEEAYLIMSYDYATDETSVVGVQKMESVSEADSMVRKLDSIKPGDKIKPIYSVYYMETDTFIWEEGEEVIYKDGSDFQEETLADGKYKEFIRVKDPRGDKYYTANVEFEMKNGKAKNVAVVESDTD